MKLIVSAFIIGLCLIISVSILLSGLRSYEIVSQDGKDIILRINTRSGETHVLYKDADGKLNWGPVAIVGSWANTARGI